MFIAEKTGLQGTKKEILDRIKQRIDSYLLPHIGQKKEDRLNKAVTICKLIKQFLIAKENPELRTDKDHYSNKRVRLSGDLLANLFRVNLGILIRDIQYAIQKSSKRKKFFSIKIIAKSTLFSHRVESAIATGPYLPHARETRENTDWIEQSQERINQDRQIPPGNAAGRLDQDHAGRNKTLLEQKTEKKL